MQYYINRITTTNSEMLERLQEAIVVKSKRLMDIPPEIKEAWEKVRPRIRIIRSSALSVLDVSNPQILVNPVRSALIEDFLLESVLASALESTATSLLTAAAEEEIELERSSP